MRETEKSWLALEIGNSRLHWALFQGDTLDCSWDTDYLAESVISQDDLLLAILPLHQRTEVQQEMLAEASPPPIFLASVVPSQTELWQTYPNIHVITLDKIPLRDVYPTLGIDRALALWGAGKTWGFPMLVIDAGTALTFTAADDNQCLVGGAILPGLGLQFATLGQKTGQLPLIETKNIASLPPHFALNTLEAIQSGIIYTVIAGIKDFIEAWWCLFPEGKIAIKGGDRILLSNYIQALYPAIASRSIVEPNLTFWGMREIVLKKNSGIRTGAWGI